MLTLERFCDENPLDPDTTSQQCLDAIEKVHHGNALRAILKILLTERSKVHVLWLWGEASVGKSYFIRKLRQIFASSEVAWHGEYLPAKDHTR